MYIESDNERGFHVFLFLSRGNDAIFSVPAVWIYDDKRKEIEKKLSPRTGEKE